MFSFSEFGIGTQAAASLISPDGSTAYIISDNFLVSISLEPKSPKLQWSLDLRPHFNTILTAANTSFIGKMLSLSPKSFLFLQPCLSSCGKYLAVPIKTHNETQSQLMVFNITSKTSAQLICSHNIEGGLIAICAQSGTSAFYGATSTSLISFTLLNEIYVFSLLETKHILISESKQKLTIIGIAIMGKALLVSLSNNSLVILSTKNLAIMKRVNIEGQLCDVYTTLDVTGGTDQSSFIVLSLLSNLRSQDTYTCLLYNIKRLRQDDLHNYIVGMFSFPLKMNKYTQDFQILSHAYTRDSLFLNILFTGSDSEPFAISIPTTFQNGVQETPGILPVFYDDPIRMDKNVDRDKLVLCAHISATEMALAPKAVAKLASSMSVFDSFLLDMIACTDGPADSGESSAKGDMTDLAALEKEDRRVIKICAVLILRSSIENTVFCTKGAHAASKLSSLSYPATQCVENCHTILIGAQYLKAYEDVKPQNNIYEFVDFYSPVAVFACLRYNQLYIVLERAIMRQEHREHLSNKQASHTGIGVILSKDPDYIYVFNNIRVLLHVSVVVIQNSVCLLTQLANKHNSTDRESKSLSYLCKFMQPIAFAASKVVDTLLKVRSLDNSFGSEASTIRIIGETVSSALSMMHYLTTIRPFARILFPLSHKDSHKFDRIGTILKYTKTNDILDRGVSIRESGTQRISDNVENEAFFNCNIYAYSMMQRSIKKSMNGEHESPHMLYTHEFGYYTVDKTMNSSRINPYQNIPDFTKLYATHNLMGNTAIWSLVQFYNKLIEMEGNMAVPDNHRTTGSARLSIIDAIRSLVWTELSACDARDTNSPLSHLISNLALLKEAGVHGCRIFIIYALLINGESPKACMDACVNLCQVGTNLRSFILQAAKIGCLNELGTLEYTDEKQAKAIEYYARCIYLAARILFAIDMGYSGPLDREIEDVSLSDDRIYITQLRQILGEGDFISIQLLAFDTFLGDAERRNLRLLLFHALSYLPYAGQISTSNRFYTVNVEDVEKSAKQWAGRLCHLSLLKGLISLARPLALSATEKVSDLHDTILWPFHPGVTRTELIMRSCIMSSVFLSLKEPAPGVHSAEHQRFVEKFVNQQMSRAIYQLRKDLNKIVSNDTSFCTDISLGLRLCYIFSELTTNRYRIERFYDELYAVPTSSSDVEPETVWTTLQTTMHLLGRSAHSQEHEAKPINTLRLDELNIQDDDYQEKSNLDLTFGVDAPESLELDEKLNNRIVPIYCRLINYSPITKVEVSAVITFCLHHEPLYAYLLSFLMSHDIKKALQFLQTLITIKFTDDKLLNSLITKLNELKTKVPFCLRPLETDDMGEVLKMTSLTLSTNPSILITACKFSLDPQLHLPYNLTDEATLSSEANYSRNLIDKSFLTYTRLETLDEDEDGRTYAIDNADILQIPRYEEVEMQPVDATQPLFLLKKASRNMAPIHAHKFGDNYLTSLEAWQAQGNIPDHNPATLGNLFAEHQDFSAQMQMQRQPPWQVRNDTVVGIKKTALSTRRPIGLSIGQGPNKKPLMAGKNALQKGNPYTAKEIIQNNARAQPHAQRACNWNSNEQKTSSTMDTKVSPITYQFTEQTNKTYSPSNAPLKSAMKQNSRFTSTTEPQPKKNKASVNFLEDYENIQDHRNTINTNKQPDSVMTQMNIAGNIMMDFHTQSAPKSTEKYTAFTVPFDKT